MIPFKSDYTFGWFSNNMTVHKYLDGSSEPTSTRDSLEGVFYNDVRHLSSYRITLPTAFKLVWQERTLSKGEQMWVKNSHYAEEVYVQREITFKPQGFNDTLTAINSTDKEFDLNFKVVVDADFEDAFGLRNSLLRGEVVDTTRLLEASANKITHKLTATLTDKACVATTVVVKSSVELRVETLGSSGDVIIRVPARESVVVDIEATFSNSLKRGVDQQFTKNDWSHYFEPFAPKQAGTENSSLKAGIYWQSVSDLHALLLETPSGAYPAAGVPLFVTPFGRDGLLVANMLVNIVPDLAKSVLSFGSLTQGRNNDLWHEEEPGKIFHEVRQGPIANTGKTQFDKYYGSVDSTPLWIKLLADYIEATEDLEFLKQQKQTLDKALSWIEAKQNKHGFLQFLPSGGGLANQNWKDSPGSNCHHDGSQAQAPIANIEVQGYTYAALQGASKLYQILGDEKRSNELESHALKVFNSIQELFWVEDMDCYAMGIDAKGRVLNVKSSNPSHLLWCNAVPKDKAPKLINTMMSESMWSGWGLRTLASDEKAYRPLGYHIGAVWPHDTALFALGAEQYGCRQPLDMALEALYAMALSDDAFALPEVTGGFPRVCCQKPIPCERTCIPQAWAATALIALQAQTISTR